MPDNLAVLELAARWAHLAACLLVFGLCTAPLLAGRPERPTAAAWQARVERAAAALLLAALGAGLVLLAIQTARAEGRAAAALEPAALVRMALETWTGHVWLGRQGLLLLLAAFLVARPAVVTSLDWGAARAQCVVLAAAALGLGAAAGHAASAEPGPARAVAAHAVHLLAAGAWLGGLPALAALLRAAGAPEAADTRPYAVLAVRRFSRLAPIAIAALLVSGVANAAIHVGGVAGLVGTTYGRLLGAKLVLLAPILAVAALNRRRVLPALAGPAETVGRPAMRRLAILMMVEAALGLLLVGVVAALGTTPPARHQPPAWPFPFRLALSALETAGDRTRALIGSQAALLGLVAVLAWAVARGRSAVLAGGLALVAAGLALALPPLAMEASPMTYVRPPVPYNAASIARGAALHRRHCAACHGGWGEGAAAPPGTATRPERAVGGGMRAGARALTGPRTTRRTAGDLFWRISRGTPDGRMPAFGPRLDEDACWDLVNAVRALGAGPAVRRLDTTVAPGPPRPVAPDFAFSVGPMPAGALHDYRGRRIVLLVVYSLPGSRPRLAELARDYAALAGLGVEIVAVPRDADPRAIRALGADPPILFPVVTEGARDVVATYDLFGAAPHVEYLIDRQGYLRARWTGADPPAWPPAVLRRAVEALNAEPVGAPAADEHLH